MIVISPDARALIFDCDGTLADTMPLHWEAWHETFAVMGAVCPHEFLAARSGIPTEQILEDFNRQYGIELHPVRFADEKQKRVATKLPQVRPIEPVVAIVHKYRNVLPMAVVSGGSRCDVLYTLDAIGLGDAFAAVLTADDPIRPKPAPDIFLRAAELLSTPPAACQVFEDGEAGLVGAKAAGMIITDVRPFI